MMAHLAHGSIFTTIDEHHAIVQKSKLHVNTLDSDTDPTGSPMEPEPTGSPMEPEPIILTEIEGIVTTVAGNNLYGHVNGQGTNATFQGPNGIAVDTNGVLYVADTLNYCIRKITPDGQVSVFAGSGIAGFADGLSTEAQFNRPESLAIDTFGILYIIDTKNNKIRKIYPDGQVITFAGSIQGSSDGQGTNAEFYFPGGIAVDKNGMVYVADARNHKIRMIYTDGTVSTFAGSVQGFADGIGIDSQFSYPTGITVDSGIIYVADRGNARIRKILPSGHVTTLAGGFIPSPNNLYKDGTGTAASFRSPSGITIDTRGNLYVTDTDNNIIRKVTSEGVVTTIAGKPIIRNQLFADGTGTSASFRSPYGISFDTKNNILYVTDSGNNRIRSIK